MMIWGFDARTTVTVDDYKSLRELWRHLRTTGADMYIRRYVVKKALTDSQVNRLHSELRGKIRMDDSIAFLRTLWALDDPR